MWSLTRCASTMDRSRSRPRRTSRPARRSRCGSARSRRGGTWAWRSSRSEPGRWRRAARSGQPSFRSRHSCSWASRSCGAGDSQSRATATRTSRSSGAGDARGGTAARTRAQRLTERLGPVRRRALDVAVIAAVVAWLALGWPHADASHDRTLDLYARGVGQELPANAVYVTEGEVEAFSACRPLPARAFRSPRR